MIYLHRPVRAALTAGLVLGLCVVGACAASVGVGTVNADGLRLRAEASTGASVLGRASTGERVVVLEETAGGWYKVNYKCTEGYMSADYVEVAVRSDGDLGYGKVEAEGSVLNMRSGPGTGYDRVKTIQHGAVVKLIGMDSGWFKAEYQDVQGYVSSDYIAICPEQTESTQTGGGHETEESRNQTANGAWGNGVTTEQGRQLIDYAKQLLGRPYVYGGNGPNSFDCSGFTKYVYNQFGYSLNRTASGQLKNGTAVSSDQLQAGDLIFFHNGKSSSAATHVGIYIAEGKFIHASSNSYTVEIDTLYAAHNARKYIAARRVF